MKTNGFEKVVMRVFFIFLYPLHSRLCRFHRILRIRGDWGNCIYFAWTVLGFVFVEIT